MENERKYTILELEKLIRNAYNVGFCDGLEGGDNSEFRIYKNEDDFWEKNKENWINEEISLI